MSLKHICINLIKKIQRLPLEVNVSVVVFVYLAVTYSVLFLIEKPVTFSYSGPTCAKQLTLLPGLHRVSGNANYTAHSANEFKIGGVAVAAFSMCFEPKDPPQPGVAKVTTSPFGGWFGRTTFAVNVPSPPVVNVFLDQSVSTTKPLVIKLSAPDKIFDYSLKANDKSVNCESDDEQVICETKDLQLSQGKVYGFELVRHFQDKHTETVVKKEATTLSPTTLTGASIKSGELVYSKPKVIDLQFDKTVVKATLSLFRLDGDQRVKLASTTQIDGQVIHVTLSDDLPRSANYELVTEDVEATDGSSLNDTNRLNFQTSGGPKVSGVNVGHTGISMGATMVIYFDQTLSPKQDISKFVSLTGGATLIGKDSNRILVSLKSLPRCGTFSVKLTNDIQSNYDIAGNSAWSFTGRMVCHSISTIGYSAKGRAINAYYFGNGSRVVLYVGAIHGNEISTKSLMERWIQYLEANADKIPADKTIVVVPQLNPDGAAAGTRLNGRNVDLNRNFATNDWQTNVTDVNNNSFPGGGGPSPMSEPETDAIASLAQRLRPIVILSYHSIGGVVAGNLAGGSAGFAATYSQLSGYGNVTGQTAETFDYSVTGTADDYYAQRLGIASVLVELGSHSYHQFERNQSAMWAMVNL